MADGSTTDAVDDWQRVQARAARADRKQRVLSLACFIALAVLASRAVVAVLAPELHPGGSAVSLAVALVIGFAALIAAFIVAHRTARRAALLRERVAWLRLIESAREDGLPAELAYPYRSQGRTDAERFLDAVRRTARGDALPPNQRRLLSSTWDTAWFCLAGLAALIVGMVLGMVNAGADAEPDRRRWMFTNPGMDVAGLDLATPFAHAGAWRVDAHEHATGGRALVNQAGLREGTSALAVSRTIRARDVRVTTRCKALTPGTACGLAFRVQDSANYYFAQTDAARRQVILGVSERGIERTIEHVHAAIETAVWQELAVEARGERIRVLWNGSRVIDTRDVSFAHAGSAGLWAPSTAVAVFDELALELLPKGEALARDSI